MRSLCLLSRYLLVCRRRRWRANVREAGEWKKKAEAGRDKVVGSNAQHGYYSAAVRS